MSLFYNKYRSQSHRWQYWDYSAPGAYFITMVTIDRKTLFGRIESGEMLLSNEGEIANNYLNNLKFNDLYIDQFVTMPNHLHLIMIIPDCDDKKSEFYRKLNEKDNNNPQNEFVLMGHEAVQKEQLFLYNIMQLNDQ